jgi:hypothetical protein
VKREQAVNRAYKYHTNILSVNREIHDEAEEYLYKNNVFIVVTHQFTEAHRTAIPPWVPSVTEPCQTNMMHHSVEIYFSNIPYTQSSHSGITRRSWLLHSDNLACYCRAMAHGFHAALSNAPVLLICNDGTLLDVRTDQAGQQLNPGYLRLELRSHHLRKITCELQRSLLSPLFALVGPSAFVSVCGDVAGRIEAEKPEVSMGSNLLCRAALGWQTFRALNGLKVTADASAEAGEYVIASGIYKVLIHMLGSSVRTQRAASAAPAIKLPMIETQFTNAYLQLKMKDIHSFAQSIVALFELLEPDISSLAPAQSAFLHLCILAMSACNTSLKLSPPFTVAECIASLAHDGSDEHRMHDIAILKKCTDHSKIINPEDLPIDSCSIYALPLKCVRSADTKIPDHIVGHLDIEMLRQIDKKTRETINRLQKERGWHVTQFELYDPPSSSLEG